MDGIVNQHAWRARGPLNLAALLHDLTKHPKRVLPKFDPEKGIYAEDHLKIFYLALNLLNVEHEDVIYRLFPYTFDPRASSWYFSLQTNSIAYWHGLEKVFITKFGNQTTIATLMKELLSMTMEKKVQEFNQRFTTLLNSFSAMAKPTKESLVEYYTTTLIIP